MDGIEKNMSFFSIMPLELFAATVLYCCFLRHRSRYFLRIVTACIVALLLVVLKISPHSPSGQAKTGFLLILAFSFFFYLASVLLTLFCCAVSVSEAIYCATCSYLTQHISYCIHRLFVDGQIRADFSHNIGWYILIFGGCYLIAGLYIAPRIAVNGGYLLRPGRSLLLMASALSVALVLSAAAQFLQPVSTEFYQICLLYGAACCIFVLWGQISQQRRLTLQHELDLQQQLWLKHRAQYELAQKNAQIIDRKCHDLKHQIAALKCIFNQAQRDQFIQELEQSVMIYDCVVKTGNHILDTVLTEKELLCEGQGISLTCVVDGTCLDFMDAVDLYTIFGNALDNAIESVGNLADSGKKTISVQVFSQAGIVLIQTENYCGISLQFEDGLPITSKKGKEGYHGFGLKSIRYTAEKYNGFLTVRQEGDRFLLRVTIPQY